MREIVLRDLRFVKIVSRMELQSCCCGGMGLHVGREEVKRRSERDKLTLHPYLRERAV